MSLDAELDLLIQSARGAEQPAPAVRAEVRRRLSQQLQSGVVDLELERAVLPDRVLPTAPRRLPRAVSWGVPLAAIGAAAVIALRLAPLSGDPLVLAPPPPVIAAPPPVIAAPPAPSLWEPEVAPGTNLGAKDVLLADPTRRAVPESTPPPQPAAPRQRTKATEAARAASRKSPSPPSLLEESRALEQVQRALSEKRYWRALELIREQDRQFAAGQLGQERAVAKALAACNTGNAVVRSEVRALARGASGLYADRLRSACPDAFAGEPAAAEVVQ